MDADLSPVWKKLRARWKALGAQRRRRIVLGSLVAASLAAKDVVLLLFASGMFALSELGASRPAPRPVP